MRKATAEHKSFQSTGTLGLQGPLDQRGPGWLQFPGEQVIGSVWDSGGSEGGHPTNQHSRRCRLDSKGSSMQEGAECHWVGGGRLSREVGLRARLAQKIPNSLSTCQIKNGDCTSSCSLFNCKIRAKSTKPRSKNAFFKMLLKGALAFWKMGPT